MAVLPFTSLPLSPSGRRRWVAEAAAAFSAGGIAGPVVPLAEPVQAIVTSSAWQRFRAVRERGCLACARVARLAIQITRLT
jgi:hypothetical protein